MTQTMLPGMPTPLQTVGSQEMAEAFVDFISGVPTPHRFTFVGQGATRTAYLGPDNVIYKYQEDDYADYNESEYRNYRMVKDCLPKGFSVPEMNMFWVEGEDFPVITAEYITGTPLPLHPEYERLEQSCEYFNRLFGLLDCYDYNVCVRDDGTLCIVDLGA